MRSHTRASLIALCCQHQAHCALFASATKALNGGSEYKCQHTGKVCATFFSLFVYVYLPLYPPSSLTPSMMPQCAPTPPTSRNEAYCQPTC